MKRMRIAALLLALCLLVCSAFAEDDDYGMPFYIDVDITNQIVTIYNTSDNSIARQMLTSSGMNGATPLGTFYLMENGRASERSEWTYFQQYRCWVKFATRIYYGYMFHSLPFAEKDESTMIAQHAQEFGMPTSHGCMRLRVEDAEFIAKKCLVGTRVKIYESGVVNEDLRALLKISSYTGEDGMTYKEYLGISEDALGSGSVGDDVLDLQYRLCDLGYYDGEFSGKYDTPVIAAVKHLQQDLGIAQTGISTTELQEVIYSDEAPVSTGEISLSEGKSGPAVEKLQQALGRLGLYNGDMDSIYDLDVSEAIRQFQLLCGYTPDGVASPDVQHAIYYVINKIEESLGSAEFTAAATEEEILLGKVNASKNINIRQYQDTESAAVAKAKPGDIVTVLGVDGKWANVIVGGVTGYMYLEYLDTYSQKNVVMRYSAENGESYSLGSTLSEKLSGAQTLAAELTAYFANEQFVSYADEVVTLATVDTGSDDLRLNLRAEPNTESDILAEVPNGTTMRVLSQDGDFTRVGYGDQIGYLMNQYLSFRDGVASEVESTDADAGVDEEPVIDVLATIVPSKGKKKVSVYDSASEKGEVVARCEKDQQVTVLLVNEQTGWVLISTGEKEGYVKEENLQFILM